MSLSSREKATYWGLIAAAFGLVLWLLGNTLVPFIVGAAIAYLLDPLADWLERHGFSRTAATATVTGFVIILLTLALLFLVPVLVDQISSAISAAPDLVARLREFLIARFPDLLNETSSLRRALSSMELMLQEKGIAVVRQLLSSSLAVVDFLLLLVIAPVVAFYLLMDWDLMIARIDDLIPREYLETVRHLARQFDNVLSGFVRGQFTVCLVLGSFYAIALAVIGLNFGVVVGLFAGLVSFIPFVGSVVGGALSIGIALFQFWGDWTLIAAVAAVFAIGQAVEGNVLTPNLVGNSVGLHPVWLIFALSAFGALFGFAGLLVAVPIAAVIGVLGRFGIRQYKDGRLYHGAPPAPSSEKQE